MNSRTIKLTILTSIGAIALTGCVTDPVTGERKISKAAIGGVGGMMIARTIPHERVKTIVGAILGVSA